MSRRRPAQLYPFWNCGASHASRGPYAKGTKLEMRFITDHRVTPQQRRSLEERERYVVDIGLYGEPKAPDFRHRSAIRALQNLVDIPAVWGVCYLSRDEFERLWDIPGYDALRERYHATAAFPHIAEKALHRPTAKPELAPAPFWRAAAFYHRSRQPGRGI